MLLLHNKNMEDRIAIMLVEVISLVLWISFCSWVINYLTKKVKKAYRKAHPKRKDNFPTLE